MAGSLQEGVGVLSPEQPIPSGLPSRSHFVLIPECAGTTTKDNPEWIKALAEVRRRAAREGYCYEHVQAIIVAIDQYAEAPLG